LVGESLFPVAELTKFDTPGWVTSGYDYDATVTIDRPALASLPIALSSDDPALVQLPDPASVTISPGATSASFTVNVAALALPFTPRSVHLHASYAGTTLTGDVYVGPPRVAQITLDKTAVVCGKSVTATVTLNYASKSGAVEVALLSFSPGFAEVPATLTIPQGKSSAKVTVTTPKYLIPFKTAHVGIQATYGNSVYAVLTVRPLVLMGMVKSVTLSPTTVQGGMTSRGTVTLEEEMPKATKVLLQALDPAMGPQGPLPLPGSPSSSAHVPAFVTIPANQISATFKVTTTRSNLPRDRRVVRISARAVRVKYATLVID
jgi:hypothetical protein